jgi:hypothetical protein
LYRCPERLAFEERGHLQVLNSLAVLRLSSTPKFVSSQRSSRIAFKYSFLATKYFPKQPGGDYTVHNYVAVIEDMRPNSVLVETPLFPKGAIEWVIFVLLLVVNEG